MGDLSSEPSMEEILSSIKRIIAEEGEAAPGRGRRAGRATPPAAAAIEDEVLELSDPMPQERPMDGPRSEPLRTAASAHAAEDAPSIAPPVAEPTEPARPAKKGASPPAAERVDVPPDTAPIVSSGTVEATRGALDQLSRMLIKPEPSTDGTLEGLVREMLRPMLRDWLDASLPTLVEDLVAREIEKIISNRR